MSSVKVPQQNDLEQFIEFLFEGLEGYVYVVAKEPDNPESWDQAFFDYPKQTPQILQAINAYSKTHEVYMAPAIYANMNGEKEAFKATNVLWADLDGNAPESYDIPPSLVVRSSEPGHEHVYWKLNSPITDIEKVEDYNRRLCIKYEADLSGWNGNKVLRPPNTTNHKRAGAEVVLIARDESLSFHLSVFDTLAPAPEKSVDYSLWSKLDLPSLNDVIYQNRFGPDFKLLFEKGKEEVADRSTTLTNAAFVCAEAGLNDKEIFVIIDHLATRWEKFAHHTVSSRNKQLISIIEHVRIKHPNSNFTDFDQVFEYSPKALLETEIKVDWAIPGMLMKSGVMLMAGPSGVGKSQISMQFMFHLAMGKPFLGYQIDTPQKIGFFSLEMPDLEVKAFLEDMYPDLVQRYTPDEINLLNANLKILPFGELLPLNSQRGQDVVIKYLEENNWDGIFVDSIGKSILGNISSSEVVQNWINFNDKVRKRYGCFLWYIHHLRKPAPGTSAYGDQSDLYGDQYITASATSVYTVLFTKEQNLLKIRNPKNRHAQQEADYTIRRINGLTFEHNGLVKDSPNINPLEKIVNAYKNKDDGMDEPSPFKT